MMHIPNLDQDLLARKWLNDEVSWEVITDIPFLNLDPITHLVGQSNEASIIINGQKVIVLIDLGAHVSSGNSGFCEQMALEVHP